MALLDGDRRSATVKTDQETTLFVVHHKDFALLVEMPRVARKLLVGLSTRLREADRQLVS